MATNSDFLIPTKYQNIKGVQYIRLQSCRDLKIWGCDKGSIPLNRNKFYLFFYLKNYYLISFNFLNIKVNKNSEPSFSVISSLIASPHFLLDIIGGLWVGNIFKILFQIAKISSGMYFVSTGLARLFHKNRYKMSTNNLSKVLLPFSWSARRCP